jgi:hypothetical protein
MEEEKAKQSRFPSHVLKSAWMGRWDHKIKIASVHMMMLLLKIIFENDGIMEFPFIKETNKRQTLGIEFKGTPTPTSF